MVYQVIATQNDTYNQVTETALGLITSVCTSGLERQVDIFKNSPGILVHTNVVKDDACSSDMHASACLLHQPKDRQGTL
eukprot:298355-Amphidinium_carterae.1